MARFPEETRSSNEREMNTRQEEYTFEEPDFLEIPQEVRDRFSSQGMSLRWIRMTLKGNDDISNLGKRLHEGWTFVTAEEAPEMVHSSFVKEEGRHTGTVCRGDLGLAKIPTGKAVARKEFYENKSREMIDAVNSQLEKSSDSRMPISNRSRSQVTKGRLPSFN
tara:strand:- start:3269 stop:3760 length:492 start_codon:yes stop_codon:yes gene_type:complete